MNIKERKIALIQMVVSSDPDKNLKTARERVEEAARNGAQFICLPELFRTRYFPQQIGIHAESFAETIPGDSTHIFSEIAKKYKVVIIVPVFERTQSGRFYNSAVVIDADGSLHTQYHKVHIPQDPKFFEKGYFYPGNRYLVHNTSYGKIAVLICYDQWFPEAARCVSLEGADIIFYPTAIGNPYTDPPEEGDWQEAWELIQRSHAIANSVHVVSVNRAGQEGDIRFFGGSFICDAFGRLLAHAGDGEETITATVDLEMNTTVRNSWGFFRNRRPDTYNVVTARIPEHDATAPIPRKGDTPRKLGYFMPAEWELHEAVWISWPQNRYTFPNLSEVEDAYTQFISTVISSEHVHVFVPTSQVGKNVRKRLKDAGIDLSKVTIRIATYSDVWIRDYGPTFVVNPALKKTALVHWDFNAWGEKYEDQIADGHIPVDMNTKLKLPVFKPGIILEGGSIDTNGRGTILTSRACLLNKNRNPHLSQDEIEDYLKEYLGAEKIIWLNKGVVGDDTDGHIDDIARFVTPTTVVCAYENNSNDENFAALKENYEILQNATDQEGKPLTVIKLSMPDPVIINNERFPASYTNFYIGNTVVVVPVFSDPHDDEALHIIKDLFPTRKVVGINARAMVEGYGTFHCATQQQPLI